jgi:hypothetical protein
MHPEDCDHMRDIVVLETVEDIDKDKVVFIFFKFDRELFELHSRMVLWIWKNILGICIGPLIIPN